MSVLLSSLCLYLPHQPEKAWSSLDATSPLQGLEGRGREVCNSNSFKMALEMFTKTMQSEPEEDRHINYKPEGVEEMSWILFSSHFAQE